MKRTTYLNQSALDNIKNYVAMYGAGTQSTGMILDLIEREQPLDFALFADTGGEPEHVIEYKEYFSEYVRKEYGVEIVTVKTINKENKPMSLEKETLEYMKGNRKRVANIPLFLKGDGSEIGKLIRQCTGDYKINPSDKYIKKRLEIRRKNVEQTQNVAIYMGISIDEAQRMKYSTEWWKVILYPLVEEGFTRQKTIDLVNRHGLKEPPRSACYFCPFHSHSYWKHLKKEYPNEFKKAIEFDEAIRNNPKLEKQSFIYKKGIPLKDVDFDNQIDLFDMIDDCGGYCGI